MGAETDYAWGDEPERRLNVYGADAFERSNLMQGRHASLAHMVAMVLLKLKLLLDLRALRSAQGVLRARLPSEIVDKIRGFLPLSSIVAVNKSLPHASTERLDALACALRKEVDSLCRKVALTNI